MYFPSYVTLQNILSFYRSLCMIHHPDLGGSVVIMQDINLEYDGLLISLAHDENVEDEAELSRVHEILRTALDAIIRLPGIHIEICYLWIWVSGETRQYKDLFKAAGYHWAYKKCMWYYAGVPSSNRSSWSIDQIRQEYGSESIPVEEDVSIA